MTEKEIKALCKLVVESSSRPLTEIEKELFKQAIDSSNNWVELLFTMKMLLTKN